MRPIIFAAMLAIGIHGLLLGMELDWLKKKNVHRQETRAIIMTLTYLQPQVIQSKAVVKKSPAVSIVSPKSQKKPLISKKTLRAHVKSEKVIFSGDIKKKTPVVRKAIPLYRVNPLPKYPRIARKRGYQGTVVFDVLVDQNGRVGDLRLFTSSGYSILDRSAMASVKGWLFKPGMKGDKKLDMWVRVPVRFELK